MEIPAKHIWIDPLDTDFRDGSDCKTNAVILKNKDMSFLVKYKLVVDKRCGKYVKKGSGVVWQKRRK